MDNYYPMVDLYPQIKAALELLPDNPAVRERWPRAERKGSLIVVTEITNISTGTETVDQLSYQVDVWADDEDTLRRMCSGVDEALSKMGLKRTLAEPFDDSEGFRKIFRYGRRVDKILNRLID